ncbi:MAG: LamG domain-containing protein [Planctomycetota bacterium]|nr:MAG: LamG domain-containing protein [Planctomycetota bacterium]
MRKILVGLMGLGLLTWGAHARAVPLVGEWLLDEGSGQTAADTSGHGLDAQLGSSPAVDSSDPTWFTDGSVTGQHFQAGTYDEVPFDPLLEPLSVTLEVRARWNDPVNQPGSASYLAAKPGGLGPSYGLYTGAGSMARGIYFAIGYSSGGSTGFLAAGQGWLWDTAWHTFVGSWDASTSTARLWRDGQLLATRTAPVSIAYDGSPFRIGSFAKSTLFTFQGDIDFVRLYDRALAPDQLAAIPEPPAWALLAAGLVSLSVLRYRRQRAATRGPDTASRTRSEAR